MQVLFGVKVGAEDWQEEVLTEVDDGYKIDMVAAEELAAKLGYDRLRVAEIDLSAPPEFGANVLNI